MTYYRKCSIVDTITKLATQFVYSAKTLSGIYKLRDSYLVFLSVIQWKIIRPGKQVNITVRRAPEYSAGFHKNRHSFHHNVL